ncbi:MAG: hypothetical protein HYV68_03430 [Candidatus Taylorbacteria bacterium]|nr:hypothetical protein [Candidatus Taylorbacteria bacterium]
MALVKARVEAVKWHNAQKQTRLLEAKDRAEQTLSQIDSIDGNIRELAFAMLYLGEGSKKKIETSLGNTDPLILKFFVKMLVNHFGVDPSKIKCALHLRNDQNSVQMKEYWAAELGLTMANFTTVVKDKRTAGIRSYDGYKGVCVVNCGKVEIQRKMVYLSRAYCERVICALSSIGRALR